MDCCDTVMNDSRLAGRIDVPAAMPQDIWVHLLQSTASLRLDFRPRQ